jgi:2'-hydroxyisoflavone reductase
VISTISVYPRVDSEDVDETSAVGVIDDPTTEKVDNQTYGPLKALCEKAAEEAYPGRATAIRPGLIVGDGDDTNRFAYWPLRVARGGEILAPLGPDQTVQIVDVVDLGNFTIKVVEDGVFGVYNAVSPPIRFDALFAACLKVSKTEATITYVDRALLDEEKVAPWADLPAWFPPPEGSTKAPRTNSQKAIARGLTFRPLEETVAAVLAYEATRPSDGKRPFRFTQEREAKALKAFKARAK